MSNENEEKLKQTTRQRFLDWARNSPLRHFVPSFAKKLVRKVVAGNRLGIVELGNGAQLEYGLGDRYWGQYAPDHRNYEPEIRHLIDKYAGSDTLFIDCGANIGMWSCYAGAKIKNPDQVVAVEPSNSVSGQLQRNQKLNGNSFTWMPDAIWDKAGETKEFMVHKDHAGSSLKEEAAGGRVVTHTMKVKTTSIDAITETVTAKAPHIKDVIIKLDVEGVEREALEGAKKTLLQKNTVIVYEDHGEDPNSETTKYFMEQCGLNIYHIDPKTLAVRAIRDTEEMRPLKPSEKIGYNFIACAPDSEFDREFAKRAAQQLTTGTDRFSWVTATEGRDTQRSR